jgi:hypothetical protein
MARELADSEEEDSTVQVLCGTVLASAGENEKAIELLGKHHGNLEAYVLGLPTTPIFSGVKEVLITMLLAGLRF